MKHSVTRVYAFGSNGSGQLGVGHCEDLNEPQRCCFQGVRLEGEREKQGTGSDLNLTPDPEMGLKTATTLPDGDGVAKLVAGGNHTVILTSRGCVWVSGDNSDGRCGTQQSDDEQNSKFLVFNLMACMEVKRVTDVAATWEATFIVTDAQAVWSCGGGRKGELGAGEGVLQMESPVKVFDVSEIGLAGDCSIVGISGSMNHVVVLLSDGTAYGWGKSRKGQLGESLQMQKIVWTPRQVNLPSSFLPPRVVTGRDFTLFVGADGSCMLLGDFKATGPPTVDGGQSDVRYFAGWSTIYSLDRGRVRGWGQGRRGQHPPAELPSAVTIAAGSEHCIALLEDGTVVAWGWGEHGNCGLPLDDRSCVVNHFNMTSLPTEPGAVVAGIGAGCASSFMWTVGCE